MTAGYQKKINILHLLNNYGDSSITRIVQRLILQLGFDRFSWHVGVMDGYGDMRDDFKSSGTKVIDFSTYESGKGINATARIKNYIKDQNIEIVHTHTPRTIMMAALALRPAGKTLHVATKHILQAPGDRRFGLFFSAIDQFSLYLPDHLVAVSNKIHDKIVAYPGIGATKVTVIQNAIDTEAFDEAGDVQSVRKEFGIDEKSPVVGCAVRIEKVKRLDLLLDGFSAALQRFPGARLMIIGDGKIRSELENHSERLGVSGSVIWTGFRKDIPRLLGALDIYIQSSINEGLSLSILEAMAAGKPVILTDVGGAKEVITNDKNGILIPPGSVAAITEALVDLLLNPDKRKKIGIEARNHVRQKFSLDSMTNAYSATYEQIASRFSAV